ncbi:T9SS type A sorting domain-containing protein [uncultured Winogradskyella sp.]|uniref:T9SS type A sorting domain-containing protein n=1 Tax=Winogradskyella sp. 4-2091 TaxID=3381659 RepID=UPI00263932DE|nr:T9SS type A sorting domain-containing protein [uncultured Winogradskyella sp.]
MKHLYILIFSNVLFIISINAQASFFKTVSTTSETNRTVSPGIEFNGYHYFTAATSTYLMRTTLWKTNGTATETIDFIDNEDDIYSAQAMFVFNNELYYLINELGISKILKTDGTTSVTFLEATNESPYLAIENRTMAVLNTNFIFSHGSQATGYELYISDGTPNNHTMVKDINPGSNSSAPIYFSKIANNKVVFIANDGSNGKEIWVTDGTTTGTNLVKDINPNGNASINGLTSFNGKAYFQLGNDIWETDGTEEGTIIFLNLRGHDNSETPFHIYKDHMYFTAYDASFNKVDLWKTDGTTAGSTILVSNLNYADVFKGTNDILFFAAQDDTHGYELWRTDGTVSGTHLTRDIVPGIEDGLLSNLSENDLGNGGDQLYFQAVYYDDDGNTDPDLHRELWTSDGTTTGTVLHTTINQTSTGSYPESFFNINDKLLFKADVTPEGNFSNQGLNLWSVDTNLLSVLEQENISNKLKVYPNPSSNSIAISNKDNINEVVIFSMDGREIKTINSNFGYISIHDLSSGTYLLSVKLKDGKHSTLKFLKQ